MRSGKVKIKQINNVDVKKLFGQMIGEQQGDFAIVKPKYDNLIKQYKKMARALNLFCTLPALESLIKDQQTSIDEIKNFSTQLNNLVDEKEAKTPDDVFKFYNELKEHELTNNFIITFSILRPYQKSLEDKDKLSDRFIKTSSGISFKLLSFTDFNFKAMYLLDEMNDQLSKVVLGIFHHIYILCGEVYKVKTTPDVDINNVVNVLMANLQQIKKQVPRCNEAFRELEKSVDLLKDRFGNYYKDYVQTSNSSTILENFVVDVSSNVKNSSKLTFQFGRIIKFIREKSQVARQNNPQLNTAFKMLDDSFAQMEKQSD